MSFLIISFLSVLNNYLKGMLFSGSFRFPAEAVSLMLRASSMLKHEDDLSDGVAQIIFMLQPEKPLQAA